MLPVRAFSFNIPSSQLTELTALAGIQPISSEAVTYLDDRRFRKNLSARAVKSKGGQPEKYVVSERLYDLFRPIMPRRVADKIQRAINIQQVVAAPFFLDNEVLGNLFAASSAPFDERDIEFLIAFGHQAAAALQSQRNLSQLQTLERVVFGLQRSMTDETQALQMIVDAVVHRLGYMGAMVATLENDNVLPVRGDNGRPTRSIIAASSTGWANDFCRVNVVKSSQRNFTRIVCAASPRFCSDWATLSACSRSRSRNNAGSLTSRSNVHS